MPEDRDIDLEVTLAKINSSLEAIDLHQRVLEDKIDDIRTWVYGDSKHEGATVRMSKIERAYNFVVWVGGSAITAIIGWLFFK